MPLSNPWWESDPNQCYWIEITERENLGEDLLSPKLGRGGRSTPGYESMVHVQPGDIVFHYWKQSGQEPAIVSFSQAVGPAVTSTITWRPRGKNATQLQPVRSSAWRVPLGGMTDLSRVVTLSDLRGESKRLRELAESLTEVHGEPIYFPFAWYNGKLRAQQAYLNKFPIEIVNLFPDLQVLARSPSLSRSRSPRNVEPRSKTAGYVADPLTRKAIELQAMKQAEQLLRELGYQTEDVSAGSPYDLHAIRGDEVVAVEVKGSASTATTVEVTIGEVRKALEPNIDSMLIVVDQIPIEKHTDRIATGDGRVRFWPGWCPELASDRLQPIRFRYLLEPLTERD